MQTYFIRWFTRKAGVINLHQLSIYVLCVSEMFRYNSRLAKHSSSSVSFSFLFLFWRFSTHEEYLIDQHLSETNITLIDWLIHLFSILWVWRTNSKYTLNLWWWIVNLFHFIQFASVRLQYFKIFIFFRVALLRRFELLLLLWSWLWVLSEPLPDAVIIRHRNDNWWDCYRLVSGRHRTLFYFYTRKKIDFMKE